MSQRPLSRIAGRVPPFRGPRGRAAALNARDGLGRWRRHLFERLGSDRYSRPALYDMDRKLQRHLGFRDGFFVEAGAHDGHLQSNTYYLERFRGWSGVLVEPIPALWRRAVRERPRSRVFNCALVADETPRRQVTMSYGGLMSVVRGARGSEEADRAHATAGSQHGWDRTYTVTVPARTLSSVLDEAGASHIDLLSLDVEGYEVEVLSGLELERHAPAFMLIEMLERDRMRADVERLIGGRYEPVEELSPFDLLYRRRPE